MTASPSAGSGRPDTDRIALYRAAMTRVRPDDWEGLRQRDAAACVLGRLGFVDRDRTGWELAQLATWRLYHRAHGRPTDRGDLCVLDTLFAASDAAAPSASVPHDPDPRVFCDRLRDAVVAAARVEPDPISRLCAASLADWRYIAHNMLAEALDFTRTIAVASLPLPHRHARLMYHNLYDEAGRGVWERNHFKLFADFARYVGVPVPGFDLPDADDEVLLEWTVPEVIAEINEHNRALWAESPGPALGALYVVEYLVPTDFRPLITSLRGLGVPADKLVYFEAHVDEDPGHAEDWIAVVAEYARSPEEQAAVFQAAVRSARWYAVAWEALCSGWRQWAATGSGPARRERWRPGKGGIYQPLYGAPTGTPA